MKGNFAPAWMAFDRLLDGLLRVKTDDVWQDVGVAAKFSGRFEVLPGKAQPVAWVGVS